MAAKTYFYDAGYYTLAEIANKSGQDYDLLSKRIKRGWSIEAALVPVETVTEPTINPVWEGKNLIVRFPNKLPIHDDMQPDPNKEYVAWLQKPTYTVGKMKTFYVVLLDTQNPLIVYPTEFEIIREAENQTIRKRNWMIQAHETARVSQVC